jgi:hypothetical protein
LSEGSENKITIPPKTTRAFIISRNSNFAEPKICYATLRLTDIQGKELGEEDATFYIVHIQTTRTSPQTIETTTTMMASQVTTTMKASGYAYLNGVKEEFCESNWTIYNNTINNITLTTNTETTTTICTLRCGSVNTTPEHVNQKVYIIPDTPCQILC